MRINKPNSKQNEAKTEKKKNILLIIQQSTLVSEKDVNAYRL